MEALPLLERLRGRFEAGRDLDVMYVKPGLLKESADRIEQLEAALRYARPIIVRWCYTQGNNHQFIVETTKQIDDALGVAPE